MKKLLLVISMLVLFVSIVMGVNAHPGKTDGAGGHTDHSTGEYHYHHGYLAHSHYDMDEDGDIDCPYNFDDQTDHSNKGNTNTQNKADRNHSKPAGSSQKAEPNKNQDLYCNIIIGFVFAVFIVVNGLSLYIDKDSEKPNYDTATKTSIFLSCLSTILVFLVSFVVLFIAKQPLTWIPLSFEKMINVIFGSLLLCWPVWILSCYLSLLLNGLLCDLCHIESYNVLFRLAFPFSYAFVVMLITLK